MRILQKLQAVLSGYGYDPIALSPDFYQKDDGRRHLRKLLLIAGPLALLLLFVVFHAPTGSNLLSFSTHSGRLRNASRRIAIVMHNSDDTDMFTSETYGSNTNHQRYADIHSYPFIFSSQPYVNWTQRGIQSGWVKSSGEHGYNKLIHLFDSVLKGMQTHEYDWVFWADGDTWIANPAIELESYLPPRQMWDQEPSPYFIAAPDENGFNDGTFFLRVNYWSLSFLAQSFADLYSPITRFEGYSDQRSICRALLNDTAAASHFYRIDQSFFNLYPGVLSELSVDTEIHNHTLQIHLVDKLKRDPEIFQRNMDSVSSRWKQAEEEMRQLGFRDSDVDQLLAKSIEHLPYDKLAKDLAATFWRDSAKPGIDGIAWLDIQ